MTTTAEMIFEGALALPVRQQDELFTLIAGNRLGEGMDGSFEVKAGDRVLAVHSVGSMKLRELTEAERNDPKWLELKRKMDEPGAMTPWKEFEIDLKFADE